MEFSLALMIVERPLVTETPMSSYACDADARSAEIFCTEQMRLLKNQSRMETTDRTYRHDTPNNTRICLRNGVTGSQGQFVRRV